MVRDNAQARSLGYTLLELLVVLALIGLIATLAAPLAGKAVANATLNADARALAAWLRSQKEFARKEQRNVTVAVTNANVQGLQRDAGLSAQAQISATPFEYFPDGTTTGGRVTLHEDGQVKTVVVSWLTGAIAIEDAP